MYLKMNQMDEKKKISFRVGDVMVTKNGDVIEGTASVTISSQTADPVELCGLLYEMLEASKLVYETRSGRQKIDTSDAEILVVKKIRDALNGIYPIQEVKRFNDPNLIVKNKNVKAKKWTDASRRKWTPEQIEKANQTRQRNKLKKELESRNSEK